MSEEGQASADSESTVGSSSLGGVLEDPIQELVDQTPSASYATSVSANSNGSTSASRANQSSSFMSEFPPGLAFKDLPFPPSPLGIVSKKAIELAKVYVDAIQSINQRDSGSPETTKEGCKAEKRKELWRKGLGKRGGPEMYIEKTTDGCSVTVGVGAALARTQLEDPIQLEEFSIRGEYTNNQSGNTGELNAYATMARVDTGDAFGPIRVTGALPEAKIQTALSFDGIVPVGGQIDASASMLSAGIRLGDDQTYVQVEGSAGSIGAGYTYRNGTDTDGDGKREYGMGGELEYLGGVGLTVSAENPWE